MSVNWVACGTCYRKAKGSELGGTLCKFIHIISQGGIELRRCS